MPQPSPEDRFDHERAIEHSASVPEELDPDVLDAVVRATVASASEDRLTERELSALKDVARRWGDAPFSLDPIAVDLVQAMVLANYGQLRSSKQDWHGLAVRIATQLYESPPAHARLHNLWQRLVESV